MAIVMGICVCLVALYFLRELHSFVCRLIGGTYARIDTVIGVLIWVVAGIAAINYLFG